MKKIKKSAEVGGRTLTLETGQLAGLANASVMARYGDTVVLATVVSAEPKEDLGYFPLSVDYEERLYAGGRIKGSRWVKRSGRPSDDVILTDRLIDRSIRPLFPKDYKNEVQVIITVFSVDGENDPRVLAGVATSAALAISSIPWHGPIGVVRVGLKENSFIVNPTINELESSELDLVVSSLMDKTVMLEGSGQQVPEEQFLKAIQFGKKEGKKIIDLIDLFQKSAGVKKQVFIAAPANQEILAEAKRFLKKIFDKNSPGENLNYEPLLESFFEKQGDNYKKKEIAKAFDQVFKEEVRKKTLTGKRVDGRGVNDIRTITTEAGLLPRTHGSALFQRGETQILAVTTLGSPALEQIIESPLGEENKRYIHHYSMPPFSTGNVGRMTGPSRREIGHGALAEKAIEPILPSEEKFPYTIMVVSEALSSNGSTSMASVCGSSLSLMDAGVPILTPVAGIAIGLITSQKSKNDYVILSDIAGIEDFNGDMDFKVAGTEKGITAVQVDIKINGLTDEIVEKALTQAKQGRFFILEKMAASLSAPRPKISQYAPKITVIHIEIEKIGEVIGPGGRMIKKIISETECDINVEDDGSVSVIGADKSAVDKAIEWIKNLTREVQIGDAFEGTVKRIQPFGAFVEILPNRDGLVHVSQMTSGYVSDPSQIVSLDQKVQVRVIGVIQGKISLSMISEEESAQKKTARNNAQRTTTRPNTRFDSRSGPSTAPRRYPSSSRQQRPPSSRWQR